jgi:glycosyltransferase involved in cell wall biosynthesis
MSKSMPLVSIGLPVHNGGAFLSRSLDSLLGQTETDLEIIISDNASTDETESICRAYVAKDSRVSYCRNESNLGLPANFNRVFQLSTGRYFKWATADDICQPEYLRRCVDVLDRDATVVLAYPRSSFIDADSNPVEMKDPGWNLRSQSAKDRFRYIVFAGHWNNAGLGLIRASALSKTRLLPKYPAGDFRLLGELSLLGKFFEIPEYLFCRRLHSAASSQNGQSLDARLRYYWGHEGSFCLPYGSLILDHFLTVWHSNLAFSDKLSLTRSLFLCARWGRRHIFNELREACTTYVLPHWTKSTNGRPLTSDKAIGGRK